MQTIQLGSALLQLLSPSGATHHLTPSLLEAAPCHMLTQGERTMVAPSMWTENHGTELSIFSHSSHVDIVPSVFLRFIRVCFLCTGVLPTHMSVHCMCSMPTEGRRWRCTLGFRVTDSCERPFGCGESHPGPLEELLPTEPYLQSLHLRLLNK